MLGPSMPTRSFSHFLCCSCLALPLQIFLKHLLIGTGLTRREHALHFEMQSIVCAADVGHTLYLEWLHLHARAKLQRVWQRQRPYSHASQLLALVACMLPACSAQLCIDESITHSVHHTVQLVPRSNEVLLQKW